MPRLPRAEDITRQAPGGTSRVTMRSTANQYQALTSVGRALGQAVDEVTDWQIAKARAAFLTAKAKEDNAYDQDNDYSTMPTRYQENMNSALQSAGEMISSPQARNLFMTEAGVDIAQGTQRISGIARREEQTQNLAFIEESLTGLQEASMTGDPTTAIQSARDLVGTAVARGDMDEDEAGRLMRTWSNQTLKTRIEAMEPERRLEELEKPWADKIPTGLRVQLRNEADRELLDGKAMENVDSYFRQDMGYAEAREEIMKIEDPDLREVTERRFETEFTRTEKANNIAQEEMFDEYAPMVREGTMRVLDIPVEVRDAMNAQAINSLYSMEGQANQKTHSDREVVDNLFQLYADGTGDPAAVRRYFMEHGDQLSDSDFEQWSAVTASKPDFTELERKPLFSATQRVRSYTEEMLGPETDKDQLDAVQFRIQNRLSEYLYNFQQTQGRDPTGEEQDQFIRDQFFTMPTRESRRLFDESPADFKPWISMDPKEKEKSLKYFEQVKPEIYQRATDILTEGGQYELDRNELADLLSRVSLDDL